MYIYIYISVHTYVDVPLSNSQCESHNFVICTHGPRFCQKDIILHTHTYTISTSLTIS